ncbi:hypothetical protein EJ08DRAFT_647853 [Tothia fuscella]|uniref:Cyclin N-terminal domain-containing protein n=1 Tax=Tothia fuscella TaxID=1048955 RepID=A0A9P4NWN8_9PEZI|nr:hypothetical protein EJ08DRAFT_647853 [Tothia fuscella]
MSSKTLHHQRTKSASALSTLLKNGIKANPQRRTAFADVSNTQRSTVQPAKDDMVLFEKGTYDALPLKSILQPLHEIPDTKSQLSKPVALLRPAQRPISAIVHKSLPAVPVSTTVPAVPRQTAELHDQHEINVKKVCNKRTTVFQETASYFDLDRSSDASNVERKAAPVHQVLEAHPVPSIPLIPEETATAGPAEILALEPPHLDGSASKDFSHDLITSIEETFAAAETRDSLHEPLPSAPSRTSSSETIDQVLPAPHPADKEVYLPALESLDANTHKLPQSELAEVQEYWEEEEDEEYYDAEGYTTARSFRSRGDNTTGGLTMLLEPRVTARSLKELEAAKQFVDMSRTEEDIEDEAWDTSMVAEYGDDIFAYMRELEERMKPNGNYMENQAEIQWSMRAVLMDWLTQVHARFQLLPETLFLAVNYVDRFLSCKVVSLGKLQLVGATAIFVAAKYEEINCPSVQEIVYMVDGGYTVDEILKAERFMLSMLKFELGWPGPMSFLRRISKADDYDLETRTLAKYFLEVTIMDERFVASKPSLTAAAAHCMARFILGKGDWTPAHTFYSQYTYQQLRPSLELLLQCCQTPRKHHAAVFEKYTEKRYKKASIYTEGQIAGGFQLPYDTRESGSWHSQLFRRK